MYQADPNNKTKMIPTTKVANDAYGHATTPSPDTFQKRPSYVLINVNGTYAFQNFNSSSVADNRGNYVTASILNDAAGGPVKLDIQPQAWREIGSSAGTVGDVTFVYRGD
mgnify:CR=1 FL=1